MTAPRLAPCSRHVRRRVRIGRNVRGNVLVGQRIQDRPELTNWPFYTHKRTDVERGRLTLQPDQSVALLWRGLEPGRGLTGNRRFPTLVDRDLKGSLAWLGADQAARRRCATPSCCRRPWGWGRRGRCPEAASMRRRGDWTSRSRLPRAHGSSVPLAARREARPMTPSR